MQHFLSDKHITHENVSRNFLMKHEFKITSCPGLCGTELSTHKGSQICLNVWNQITGFHTELTFRTKF